MKISSQFINQISKPTITGVLGSATEKMAKDFNCMRIGIIQSFNPDDSTAMVLIANKRDLGLNVDGTNKTRDFAQIRAKVCYCNPFETFPLTEGMECILLFSDREIESWFINGDVNPLAYQRMHDLTDAVAIVGIRSLPNMIEMLADCLNLFYGSSNIALSEDVINITSPTVQASNLQAMNGANGNIVDSQGKTLAKVEYGIITEIY